MRKQAIADLGELPARVEEMTDRVAALLAEREQARKADARRAALSGGPCDWCGMGETREDRGWSRGRHGLICGRCADWLGDSIGTDRDLCAAVLVGLATPTVRRAPRGLAADVGLVLWAESGRTEPNDRPWQHVNVREMRERLLNTPRGRYSIPGRWNRDQVVVW